MHEHQIADVAKARQMIAVCHKGFESPQHWMNWRKKYTKAIEALPPDPRNAVVMAWDNASTPEFSK